MGLIEEEEEEEDVNGFQKLGVEDGVEPVSPLMYLATGLGMDGAGFGGGRVDFAAADFDESGDVEEYYRRMVNEDPCNPLFLRNYAQLLQVSFIHTFSAFFYIGQSGSGAGSYRM